MTTLLIDSWYMRKTLILPALEMGDQVIGQVLHRWTQILSTSYALPALLSIGDGEHIQQLANLCPWRTGQPIAAGRIRKGLAHILRHVDIRSLWNPKTGKFSPLNCRARNKQPPDKRNSA